MKNAGKIALMALGVGACAEPKFAEPLTAEEQARVDEIVDRAQLLAPTVEALVRAADNTFDDKRKEADADTMIALMRESQADLLYYYDHDQIRAFTEAAHPGEADPSAQMHGVVFDRENRKNDLILINRDALSSWDTSTFMHEAAHRKQLHSVSINHEEQQLIREGKDDPEFAVRTVEERDYAFGTGLLYGMAEYPLVSEELSMAVRVQMARESVESGSQASDVLKNFDIEGKESWLDTTVTNAEVTYGHIMEAYGVTTEEYRMALSESPLYEMAQEMYTEARKELRHEFQHEARENRELPRGRM